MSNPIYGCALAALFALATGVASADVTTEQKISIQGLGVMSFADMSGTTRLAISGNRSRTDSDVVMQSKLVRFLARGAAGPTAEIVLLDSDKLYRLNMNRKEYSEQSFEDLRNNMQKALQGGRGDAGEQRTQPSAIDQSRCDWLPPKSDVRKTGARTTVAGYQADEVLITAEQPCKDKESGSICEIALSVDEWLAPSFATSDEVAKYHKAYAQKLGLDSATLTQDASDRAKAMFSQYKGVWEDIVTKMKDVKGYPVRSSFSLAIGGDQCKQAQSARQQAGDTHSSGTDSSSSSGGSSASPTSPAELANQVGAKLGSLFHRKKKDDSQAAAGDQGAQSSPADAAAAPATPVATGPSGTIPLMTISSELLSISTAPIPANAFDVPADFKKVERKGAT